MIVQCHGCKTRFRIADDKVSGRGVRVRCTRCGDTFVVRPAAAGPAEPAGAPKVGGTPAPRADPPAPDGLDIDLDGPPDPPPAASPSPAAEAAPAAGVADLFGDLDLGGADGGAAPLADGGGGAGPFPAPSEADVDAALAGLDAGFGSDVSAADLGLSPGEALRAPDGAGAAAPDPFGEAGGGGEPDPFGAGAAAPDLFGEAGGGGEPDPFGAGASAPDLFGEAGGGGEPDPFGAGASAPDPFGEAGSQGAPDAFGDAGSGWTAGGPLELDGGPAPDDPAPDPFAAGSAAPGLEAAEGELDLDLDLDLGDAPAAGEPAPGGDGPGGLEADAGAPGSLGFGDDDPFATLDAGADLEPGGDLAPGGGFEPGGGLEGLDLGGPPSATLPGAGDAPAPAPAAPPRPRSPAPVPERPQPSPPPRKGGLAAVVAINGLFGLALVALLLGAFVADRTGSRFTPSVFTPARLRAAFTGASAPGLTVTHFSNGLYPTRTGGQVLVVRGIATNNGTRVAHPRRVEVRLLGPGGKVVARAIGVVGVLPSAAEVWRLDGAPAARALLETLGRRAPTEVKAHAHVPFFTVIPSWRGDLSKMRFQVKIEGAG